MYEFKIKKVQLVLFPRGGFNPIDKIKVANDIKEVSGGLFDGEPTILPLPIDAPPEIPRIILNSKDNFYSFHLAMPRIDFFLIKPKENGINVVKNDYIPIAKQLFTYFIVEQNVLVGRVGFVVDFELNLEQSANKLLQKLFLNPKHFYAAEDLILRNISLVFSERDSIGDWKVNRLVRVNSLRERSNPKNDKRLSIRIDINTIPEKKEVYELKVADIEELLDHIVNQEITEERLNNILRVKEDG